MVNYHLRMILSSTERKLSCWNTWLCPRWVVCFELWKKYELCDEFIILSYLAIIHLVRTQRFRSRTHLIYSTKYRNFMLFPGAKIWNQEIRWNIGILPSDKYHLSHPNQNVSFISFIHNVWKWSDTLSNSCSNSYKIFKVRLIILGRYALKG